MAVKKLRFHLDSAKITLRSDHLPLKKFLEKNTMNAKVNNWAVELESQNITFEFIAGIQNVLADTLSRLIELNEDIQQPAEKPRYEFGYTPFEELPPAKVAVIEEVIISEVNQSKVLITHGDPVTKNLPVELSLTDFRMMELQEQDPLLTRLRKEWSTGRLDRNHFTMEKDILRKKDNHKQYTIQTYTCTRYTKRLPPHACTQRTETQWIQENLQCTQIHVPLERYEIHHPETLYQMYHLY